jgi:Cu/Ag efflux protein CusF
MKSILQWGSALAAALVLAGAAVAADGISAGNVKNINAGKKEFVLTDAAGKDWTIKLGENLVVNRAGKESQSDLKAGDAINVCYDKGVLAWTARYILVQEGNSKNWELVHGTFKGYDADKKQFSFTDPAGQDCTFAMGDATVHLNKGASKIEDIKIGDKTLAIVEKVGDKMTLKAVMVERK